MGPASKLTAAFGAAAVVTAAALLPLEPPQPPVDAVGALDTCAGSEDVRLVGHRSTAAQRIRHPSGLAWSKGLGAMVIAEPRRGGTRVTAVAPDGATVGRTVLRRLPAADAVAVHGTRGATTVVSGPDVATVPDRLLGADTAEAGLPRGRGQGRAAARGGAGRVQVHRGVLAGGARTGWDGAAYGASGDLLTLAAGSVRRPETRAAAGLPVSGREGHALRGLAVDPATGYLHVYDTTTEEILRVDHLGRVVEVRDAGPLLLDDVRGLAFGPSADPADDASVQSLYLLDVGRVGGAARIVETSLQRSCVVLVAAAPSAASTSR